MKDYIYIANTQKAFLSENEHFLDIVLDKSIISKASYLFKLIFRITIFSKSE